MKKFFIWLLVKLTGVEKQNLLTTPTSKRTRLDGLTVGVFVREPNGSRVDLEFHLKQALSSMGATVLPVNQSDAFNLIRKGEIVSIKHDILLAGTLRIESSSRDLTHAEYQATQLSRDEEVRNLTRIPLTSWVFSYEAFGNDCSTLFAGHEIVNVELRENSMSDINHVFRILCERVILTLEKAEIWNKIVMV